MGEPADDIERLLAAAIAQREAGNPAAAIALIRQAVERHGAHASLYCEVGECYRQAGDFARAVQAYERAIQLDPDYDAAYRCGADAAIAEAKKAEMTGAGAPSRDLKKFAAMYLVAAGKRQRSRRLAGAEPCLREAIALDPQSAEAFWALGDFLESVGRFADAEEPLRRAIAVDPNLPHAYVTLGNVLQSLGRLPEMEAAYRKALALNPDFPGVRDSLLAVPLMNMLYDSEASPAAIYARHREWGDYTMAAAAAAAPFPNSRDPKRKLRVGLLSPDFRYHAVSFYFAPLLANLDPAAVEFVCYAEVANPDSVTAFLQKLGGVWRNSSGMSDDDLRARIRADQIDIAIDLAGHTAHNRLRAFAVKPAPVTAAWLGYLGTTGLPSIDWRITDARVDPEGQEEFHSEKLIRLPEVFLCYWLFASPMPAVAPVPATSRGSITFGSFNNPQKLSTVTIGAWARILAALPDSRLMLKALAFTDPVRRQAVLDRFAVEGVRPDQLALCEPQPEMVAHLGAYAEVDIALDPFPFNGVTTTCEAMWMGVPVISLIGDRHSGRIGFDLLSQVGLEDLAAPDVDAYVATAVTLARDLPRLNDLRAGLRERMSASPLCDGPRFARAYEAALRQMWQAWCATPQ